MKKSACLCAFLHFFYYLCHMLKLTQHIETTAVFWRKVCKALENRKLMGGGKSLRPIQAARQPEAYLSNQSTPCPPAWGVVVCAGAAHNAPVACGDFPAGGSGYLLTN